MDTLIIAAGVLAFAIGLLIAIAAMRPSEFRIARTVRVAAPPEQVFPLINDLETMNTWNPFDKQDPAIKGRYSGPASGVGAHYDFDSRTAGTGSVEIMQSEAPGLVVMRLHMVRPVACENRVEFTVIPRGADSDVTWAMSGRNGLVGKIFGLVCNVDRMCGGQFEKGLGELKMIAEQRRAA